MATLTFKPVFWETAKEILNKAYEADKRASFDGKFRVNGNQLSASANKNEADSMHYNSTRFDVQVSSSVFTDTTLTQIFSDYSFAFN